MSESFWEVWAVWGIWSGLKEEKWHCHGEDFICSSRRYVMWERRAAYMKQKGDMCCTFHFFQLLDG